MNIIKKITAALLAGIMTASAASPIIEAAAAGATGQWGTVVALYDANTLENFADRTKQEIADRYSEAIYSTGTYDDNDWHTWYDRFPSTRFPYYEGEITADTHHTMVCMTNFYRWMVGCEPVTGIQYSENKVPLQKGALVRNFCWDHAVSEVFKPVDMPDAMWQAGATCNHNILAQDYTPQGAVTAWMSEGYNYDIETWKSVGHRAIIMNQKLSEMSYGFCDRIAIGYGVAKSTSEGLPFTAYPSPGFMPTELVNPMNCSWSVKLNDDQFEVRDEDDLKITITNEKTGEKWYRQRDDETILMNFGLIAFVQPGDFEPVHPGDLYSMKYTSNYRVDISGIYVKSSDIPAQFTYTVRFFDMADYVQTRVVSANTNRKYMVGPDMMNIDGLNKIAAILPREIEAKADNGQTFTVPVKGEWMVDEWNRCFVNSCDTAALPPRLSDPRGVLYRVTIPYYQKTDICAQYDSIDMSPAGVSYPGTRVNLSVYRTNTSTDTLNVYRLYKKPDGTYHGVLAYDSATSPTGDIDECSLGRVKGGDSGEYISVYYDASWLRQKYETPIQVSNNTVTLKVMAEKYDITGDGYINLADLVEMKRMLSGLSQSTVCGDLNGDSRVNIIDYIELKNYFMEKYF